MPPRRAGKAALAAEAWRLIFDFFMLTRSHRDRVLERLALSPNEVRALSTLMHSPDGCTMRSLAEAWSCDASNATWIVDRLEARGLAERRSRPGDRRVKLVALTPAGLKAKAQLLAGMYETPPELQRLPRRELEALRDAAAQLPRHPEGPLLGGGRKSRE